MRIMVLMFLSLVVITLSSCAGTTSQLSTNLRRDMSPKEVLDVLGTPTRTEYRGQSLLWHYRDGVFMYKLVFNEDEELVEWAQQKSFF